MSERICSEHPHYQPSVASHVDTAQLVFSYPFPMLHIHCGLAPIFPYTFYHLTHYWFAAADIPVANDTPVHYADA
ncbi:hypothetical protein, partial [Citrobacter freundii]|uniref:hypothetical protein n=1 Tax=Citrobacter freundii TaxID=546 RepID=UPI003F7667DE